MFTKLFDTKELEPKRIDDSWFDKTGKTILSYKSELTPGDFKKLQLDLLIRISGRISQFSMECYECQMLKVQVNNLVDSLKNLKQSAPDEKKTFKKQVDELVKHLKKKHKLVKENEYFGIFSGIGAALGTGAGHFFHEYSGLGSAGLVLGLVIGKLLDKKAKRDGRVI